ncbi:MAG: hypothetical protein R3B90_10690 [Planctomycetaceae bacterium]
MGQFPGRLDRVEREVSRLCSQLLERGRPRGERVRDSGCAARSDLYEHNGRRLRYASINFVTAHDGFTLHDLAYNHKHNEANGEANRDGDVITTGAGTAVWKARPQIPK